MKKQKRIALALVTIGIIGGAFFLGNQESLNKIITKKPDLQKIKEKQLDELKKHEEEIKDFIKSQNPKIESVEIDWEETQWNQVGNGTPQGGGDVVDVYGRFNNIENSGWHVMIDVPEGEFNIGAMTLVNYLSVNGDEFK